MKLRKKNEGVFSSHRFGIAFFLYVVLYHVLVVNGLRVWKISAACYAYHAVDYSFGLRSQLLPGAIFRGLFGSHASAAAATVYETVLLLLFFAGMAYLLERFLLRAEPALRPVGFVLVLFYLSGAYTFAIFSDELGMLDVYWLFFSLLFFFVLEKKGLRLLIPALFVLSLLVHFSSVLNYLILFAILLLYRVAAETEKKEKRIYLAVFFCSLLATGVLFVFFLVNHNREMPLSIDDFHQTLEARGSRYFLYYDYSFYNVYGDRTVVPTSVALTQNALVRSLQTVWYKCLFTFYSYRQELSDTLVRFVMSFLLLSPAVLFLYKQFLRLFRAARGNRLKRFCVFLMFVQFPFTAVLGCLFSPDVIRWCTHAFLVSFTMFLYLLYKEQPLRVQALNDLALLKNNIPAWIYGLAYVSVHSWAYC